MKPRIAILISGSGTNMTAITEAVAGGALKAEISFVGSDRESAAGLGKAEARGLNTRTFSYKNGRAAAEEEIAAAVAGAGAHWIVLAGYMRILSPEFVRRFEGRIVNIHPSLLPAFPGAHAIDDAWSYGVKVTGVTVHLVDEQVDHGEILAQQAVAVEEDDTRQSLEAKIHAVEHLVYTATLKKLFLLRGGDGADELIIDSDTFNALTSDICEED